MSVTSSTKRKTNLQQVAKMMNFSQFGALKQAFIMSAIESYAASVLSTPDEKINTGLISAEAWKGCAAECISELDEHFERNNG